MEARLKHLELIQGVINRLAGDSFRMKGWAVVLASAMVVVLAREEALGLSWLAVGPTVVFWGLDGYFLWQERLFRGLYDRVRVKPECDIDFSMAVDGVDGRWLGAVFSRTLLIFYFALVAFPVALTLVASRL